MVQSSLSCLKPVGILAACERTGHKRPQQDPSILPFSIPVALTPGEVEGPGTVAVASGEIVGPSTHEGGGRIFLFLYLFFAY